jgi:hypothetical protein
VRALFLDNLIVLMHAFGEGLRRAPINCLVIVSTSLAVCRPGVAAPSTDHDGRRLLQAD